MTLQVSDLALCDYRSYETALVQFSPGINIILGSNGRGKTNLVEAITYLSTFSSFRTNSSNKLVRVCEENVGGAVIRAKVEVEGRSQLLELEIARGTANRARLNRSKVAPKELLGIVKTVVFSPEDVGLLREGPELRRTFLDQVTIKLKPHMYSTFQDFGKVSRQRAAHLKTLNRYGRSEHTNSHIHIENSENSSVDDIWDQPMASLSATIAVHRMAIVEAMKSTVKTVYEELTFDDRNAEIEYVSHLKSVVPLGDFKVEKGQYVGDPSKPIKEMTELYLKKMRKQRSREVERGINLVGSHRDDLLIHLDGLPVRGFASQGEMWSCALTLRLTEMRLLRQRESYPILVLDDVFAELDATRREGLLACVEPVNQVFVTVAVEGDIPTDLKATFFEVSRDKNGWSQIVLANKKVKTSTEKGVVK